MKPNEIEGYLNANAIYPDSIYLSEIEDSDSDCFSAIHIYIKSEI